MRSKLMVTALLLTLATPTLVLADPAPRTTSAVETTSAAPLAVNLEPNAAAADASFAQREAQANDLVKFEGGHYYYREHERGHFIAAALGAILCGLIVIALVA